jgi:hypothetical protein
MLKCLFSELPLFYILLKYSVVPVMNYVYTYIIEKYFAKYTCKV